MASVSKIKAYDPESLCQWVETRKPLLIERIAKNNELALPEARELFLEAIKFLVISNVSGDEGKPATPGLLIDEAWHEFILFTRLYEAFCMHAFGRFIHHAPGGTDEENHLQFERTLMLYGLAFGAPPRKYWGCQGMFSEPVECGAEV